MFVYKHTKAVEYVKKWPTLKKKQKNPQNLRVNKFKNRIKNRVNFQGIIFIWTQIYGEIFNGLLMFSFSVFIAK